MYRALKLHPAVFLVLSSIAFAQTESATISGKITDASSAVIAGAQIQIQSLERGTTTKTITNNSGIYVFSGVRPGHYNIEVQHPGFRQVNALDLTVNVQDRIEENFQLQIGPSIESVTVQVETPLVNTEDASVSTVVDRNFAENLPMNGRSFQTLIELTPGVVLTPSTDFDNGQFSVNGQRATSNYWTVDGVSANIGAGLNALGAPGNALGGALGAFSAQGGTNSLVSVDALQEFRIQTSTYAPEYGRAPGAQISILTRSGTNNFHGTAFDYLRNDALDANDWFADFAKLQKPEERQNDFGGTVGGPIFKDRTFFFFSYEGLRLRLPETILSTVPDLAARQSALPALQPYLNAFPRPNGPEDPSIAGAAQFNATFSNRSTLDAYSLRLDHSLSQRFSIFGRYNYSPSENVVRGGSGDSALSDVVPNRITTQTATVGFVASVSPAVNNDLRLNFSRVDAKSFGFLDNFGGAVPLNSLPIPSPFTAADGDFVFEILSLKQGNLFTGINGMTVQRQENLVDSLSAQIGRHTFKFGGDYRRLHPKTNARAYEEALFFDDVASAGNGTLNFTELVSDRLATLSFNNLGLFAQDTWRLTPRLTLTYGLRWDVDFSPSSNPALPGLTGYNLRNLSNLNIAPGTPTFQTPYAGVAPRLGLAYQVSTSERWQTVLRGGFGVFYDLADSEIDNLISEAAYPFGAISQSIGGTFPFNPAPPPPPIVPPASAMGNLYGFDPHLRLPYTLEWNVSAEQSLGANQALSASYIGAAGRSLIQTAFILNPNPKLATATLVGNSGSSDYHALQLQFTRKMSHGLQTLASYSWAHSIDAGSAGSFGSASNLATFGISNRGPSDFDVRNAFSAGMTYDMPNLQVNRFAAPLLHDWSLQSTIQVRSAQPVDVTNFTFFNNLFPAVRPDVVPGQPFYLFGSACVAQLGPPCAGGKGLNPAAFKNPPVDANGNPLRQGDLGRNALRGFGAAQWDFAVHRDFPLHESVKLQFRAEFFNVLNHPNFGPPVGDLSGFSGPFGQATQMLGRSLSPSLGAGGFSPLYQIGGPRSVQFALKLSF